MISTKLDQMGLTRKEVNLFKEGLGLPTDAVSGLMIIMLLLMLMLMLMLVSR